MKLYLINNTQVSPNHTYPLYRSIFKDDRDTMFVKSLTCGHTYLVRTRGTRLKRKELQE